MERGSLEKYLLLPKGGSHNSRLGDKKIQNALIWCKKIKKTKDRLDASLKERQGILQVITQLKREPLKADQAVKDVGQDHEDARDKATESTRMLFEVKETLALLVDVANECMVYQEFMAMHTEPARRNTVNFIMNQRIAMEAT